MISYRLKNVQKGRTKEIIFDPNSNLSVIYLGIIIAILFEITWRIDMGAYFGERRTFVDHESGEVLEAQTVIKTVGDVGFHKIWLSEILELVDEVGGAKMTVLMWLLNNADRDNRIIATKQEIATECKVGTASVQRLMTSLKKAKIITEVRRSMWRINPAVIFKGNPDRRLNLLIKFRSESEAQQDLFEQEEAASTKNNVTPLRPKATPKAGVEDVLERAGKKHAL